MHEIFTPKKRDEAIEIACRNTILAGKITQSAVGEYQNILAHSTDAELARILIESHLAYTSYLENTWILN